MKIRWIALLVGLVLTAGCSAAVNTALNRAMTAAARPSPVVQLSPIALLPTSATEAAAAPTATRERFALTQPPQEDIAEPLLTQTALSALILGQPTTTPVSLAFSTDKPHLIDFYAGWCAPCYKMRPYIDHLEAKYKDRVEFNRVNVDYELALSRKYKVQYIPLVVLTDNTGKIVNQLDGYREEKELDDAIRSLLGEDVSSPAATGEPTSSK
jgi:thiol-disulfide isomerase/thioredoxin